MPGPEQKIKTVLIPELGVELDPEFIQQSIVTPDFSRVFAHLIGKAADRGILIRATSDGSLKVVSAGVPFEEYLIGSGTTDDLDYVAPNIFELNVAYNVSDFLIELFPGIVSFRNSQGTWLPDKTFPVGMHSLDFIHYGVRIKKTALGAVQYEITVYR
ncbi:MAG: hypothetical protein GH151_01085 [Bacteroidetes bacterium]|nr:hypothetical protein [Bacteroidota bacterium]